MQQPSWGVGCLIVWVSVSHTIRHTPGKNPLRKWSAYCWGCYLHNTQL